MLEYWDQLLSFAGIVAAGLVAATAYLRAVVRNEISDSQDSLVQKLHEVFMLRAVAEIRLEELDKRLTRIESVEPRLRDLEHQVQSLE